MKLVATADIHGTLPDPKTMPSGDVLVIAGDICPDDYQFRLRSEIGSTRIERQGWWFENVFVPWLSEVKHIIPADPAGEWKRRYQKVIFCGGNHDFFLRAMLYSGVCKMLPKNVHYLNETYLEYEGVRFFGAGWNQTQGWAFYTDEDDFEEKLEYVNGSNIDVAVIHGPPRITSRDGHMTSKVLRDWVSKSSIKAFICGHIHEAYGEYKIGEVPVYVVSRKDRQFRDVNPFVEIEIDATTKQ